MSDSPKTSVIEVRLDIRTVAALAAFFPQARTRAALGQLAIEMLVEILVGAEKMKRIESTEEAIELLEAMGFTRGVKPSRVAGNLVRQLQLEDSRIDAALERGTRPTARTAQFSDEDTAALLEAQRLLQERMNK